MSFVSFLPLILLFVVFTSMVKLAAFLYRRAKVAWLHAFLYCLLVFATAAVLGTLHNAIGAPLHVLLLVVAALATQLAVGGWYLGPRAKTSNGQPLEFRGGALLSLITYALLVAICVVPALVYFGLRGAQP